MNFKQALDAFNRIHATAGSMRDDLRVAVQVTAFGTVGGTPSSTILSIRRGFDWDSSVVLLEPENPLTILTQDQLAAMQKAAKDGNSYEAYASFNKLREENKQLKDRVAKLQATVDLLTSKAPDIKLVVSKIPPLPTLNMDIPLGVPLMPEVATPKTPKPVGPYNTMVSLFGTSNPHKRK